MKKLILVVLFALLAASCGGSDDAASATSTTDSASPVTIDDSAQADDGDADSAADAEDVADAEADVGEAADGAAADGDAVELPDPVNSVPVQSRDCAHSVVDLGTGDDAVAAFDLPPDVKPEVGDEYLGPIAELTVTDLIEGAGPVAVAGATVEMEYVGVLGTDGTEFDSSWDPEDAPFSFTLGTGRVIAGWDEGIAGMKAGGRRVLQIPSAMAYGEQARSEIIVANSDLVFIVDLISVGDAPEPAPPIAEDNLGSFGELQIIDLVEGEGCEAGDGDIVTVNYVGVDAVAGEEFDSSWGRGAPFKLVVGRGQVIEGWLEGIAGMKVGGERILQIPSGMAYNEGDLVFRVHLEALVEAPLAHTVEFDGDAPDDLQITTLVEGDADGEAAGPGSIVDAHIVVRLYKSGTVVQSTYTEGDATQLALQEGALLPGLEEGMVGVRVGEIRQIILPPEVAYPDGVPENGLEDDDAFVFFVEPLRILN